MKKYLYPEKEQWEALTERPTQSYADIEDTVKAIFKEVQKNGDTAIAKYTSFFDGVTVLNMKVSKNEITKAEALVSNELKEAIALAKSNIEKFHAAQKTTKIEIETTEGVRCWQEKRAIQKVGLYIPGGSAPLFSTVSNACHSSEISRL